MHFERDVRERLRRNSKFLKKRVDLKKCVCDGTFSVVSYSAATSWVATVALSKDWCLIKHRCWKVCFIPALILDAKFPKIIQRKHRINIVLLSIGNLGGQPSWLKSSIFVGGALADISQNAFENAFLMTRRRIRFLKIRITTDRSAQFLWRIWRINFRSGFNITKL